MSYALITGASSGIGRCYAMELAKRGYGIVAVSNQHEALERLKGELTTTYGVVVHTIDIDLAGECAAKSIYERCLEQSWEVEVLVCNAGILLFSTLLRTDPQQLSKIIALHCTTTTLLCRYFAEEMKQRKRGHILIMSSATAWLPYPTISHYAATKSYLKSFASALWYELHSHNIGVTALYPGAVDTPLYNLTPKARGILRFIGVMLTPERIAKRGIRAMFHGRRRLIPGVFTKVMVAICSLIPARLFEFILHLRPIKRLLSRI